MKRKNKTVIKQMSIIKIKYKGFINMHDNRVILIRPFNINVQKKENK